MEMRTAIIDGKLMDIISTEEYFEKRNMIKESSSILTHTAVDFTDSKGNRYTLPLRGKLDDRPGFYDEGSICFGRLPCNEDEEKEYIYDDVIDYRNVTDIKDFLDKTQQIRDMEAVMLTDIDSVFSPPMLEDDSITMRAFKEAILSKHCDINKYSDRFKDNFLNDKRILKTSDITLNKLVSISKNLDIEVELTLRNKQGAPNPMDKPISVILTGGSGDE